MMKRISSCLLILCLLGGLASCKKADQQTVTKTPATMPAGDTYEPVTIDAPFASVSLPTVTENVTADNNTVIFTKSYQNISLTLDGQVTADLIILDFMNRVDAATDSADTIASAAKAAYNGSDSWVPYALNVAYSPTRIDSAVLSLFGTSTTYSGSAHPEYACISANYNLISGDPLTLGSILTHVDSVAPLCQLVIEKLEAQAEEKFLRENFQDDIRRRFAGEESYDDDWYFSQTGLCFYFSPYEIAPYSSGVITAEIPYSELVGIISDEFFPAEYSISNGNAAVIPFSNEAAEKYDQISELILDREGPMFFVLADSCIQNIRIVCQSLEGGRDDAYKTCYSAYYLNPGCAIMVQVPNEQLHLYFVEYQQDGQTVRIPLETE